MTNTINPYNSLGLTAWWSADTGNSLWDYSDSRAGFSEMWDVLAEQNDVTVSVSLGKVSDRMLLDLAGETADYLSGHPDLADDYVLVIVGDSESGREARAFKRSELLADLDPEKRAELEEGLDKEPLLFIANADEVPETPSDDEDLQGLAAVAQSFLDQNEKVINLIAKSGYWVGE
nr:hypothetical protein [uncultured Sphaerochaeta sp.]